MRLLALAAMLIITACGAAQAQSVDNKTFEFAAACGVSKNSPFRVFAVVHGKRWRQYPNARAVPTLENDAGEWARVWRANDRKSFVILEGSGEDFAHYVHYCFNASGKLVKLQFEFRTAWGWGYREIRKGDSGEKLVIAESYFFEIPGEKRIARPDQAADVAEALRPVVYKTARELPWVDHRSGQRPTTIDQRS